MPNNNNEREARVKEINKLLGKLKLSDLPVPKPMTKSEYEAMIKRWENGEYCIKIIGVDPAIPEGDRAVYYKPKPIKPKLGRHES